MSNAYQIRLELLKMAQEALNNEYFTKVDMVRTDWQNRVSDGEKPSKPELPPIYTMDEIVAKAKILNDFVSNN